MTTIDQRRLQNGLRRSERLFSIRVAGFLPRPRNGGNRSERAPAGAPERGANRAGRLRPKADDDRRVSDLYDTVHPNASDTMTVRSVFVIGPDNKVKLTLTYPASTGRDFGEILRVIDSLRLTADYAVATPADWRDGDDVVIGTGVSNEDAQRRFPGYTARKPYLRMTPQPNR